MRPADRRLLPAVLTPQSWAQFPAPHAHGPRAHTGLSLTYQAIPARPTVPAKLERAPHGPSSCSPASGKPEALPCPKQGVPLGMAECPLVGPPAPHQSRHKPVGRGPKHSRSHTGREGGLERERTEAEELEAGRVKGMDHQVSTGSDQTQGVFREVAGGAGVPVLGRKARLLRYLHQPRSRDPRALGLRKQVGTQLTWP